MKTEKERELSILVYHIDSKKDRLGSLGRLQISESFFPQPKNGNFCATKKGMTFAQPKKWKDFGATKV